MSKASGRVSAYGDVDELNSLLGIARAHCEEARAQRWIQEVQGELFNLGAELSCDPERKERPGVPGVCEDQVAALEGWVDAMERDLPPLKTFLLPGGTREAAFMHAARAVCRRAERSLVELARHEPVRDVLVRFVNRLSDFLFVMARHANHRAGTADEAWLGRHQGANPRLGRR